MNCQPVQTTEGYYRCKRCGFENSRPRPGPFLKNCTRPGLGDRVATVIRRVSGIKTCGGCRKRKQLLNRAGGKIGL